MFKIILPGLRQNSYWVSKLNIYTHLTKSFREYCGLRSLNNRTRIEHVIEFLTVFIQKVATGSK